MNTENVDHRGSVVIRHGRAEDRAAVRQVTLAAYQQYMPAMGPEAWAEYRQILLDELTRRS